MGFDSSLAGLIERVAGIANPTTFGRNAGEPLCAVIDLVAIRLVATVAFDEACFAEFIGWVATLRFTCTILQQDIA